MVVCSMDAKHVEDTRLDGASVISTPDTHDREGIEIVIYICSEF